MLGHQRWNAQVAHVMGMVDVALILRWSILREIEEMPCQQ
jgi:hypothetical protein